MPESFGVRAMVFLCTVATLPQVARVGDHRRIARLPQGADWQIVAARALEFDGIEDLEEMHDIDRALVLSEGRKKRGEWLIVTYGSEA